MAAIFLEDGERAFRALEAACARDAFAGVPSVIATGGGFFEDAANRSGAHAAGLTVYPQVEPATAARRLGGDGGRPLLQGGEPAQRLAALLAPRLAGYLEAEQVVETDGLTAQGVALRVASLARDGGGW